MPAVLSLVLRLRRAARTLAADHRLLLPVAGFASLAGAAHAQVAWTQFARSAQRDSAADTAPDPVADPAWVASTDDAGLPVEFVGQSGPVVSRRLVLALGRSGGISRVFAFRRDTGACAWSAEVPDPVFDSWSTPAIDRDNGTVLVGAGTSVRAFSLLDGHEAWAAPLALDIVNASVAVTDDLAGGLADRAFITDSDGFGTGGRLYAINVDPFDAGLNPFIPGQVVWAVTLGGTSGNSPACLDGIVFVASPTDESGLSPGIVRAFDASAAAPPAPLWTFFNVQPDGFFGGVCARREGDRAYVYAASYAFSGGLDSSNLVKLDAATGNLVWSVPCNRTSATPVVLPDGLILLSSGLQGFGSLPTVQAFRDEGDTASLLWDSTRDTWFDANANGIIDLGEFFSMGAWTHQPAAAVTPAGTRLYVGALASDAGFTDPCVEFYAIDPALGPTDPGFLLEHAGGAGSTPALAGPNAYSIGAAGLHAFGAYCAGDFDGNAAVNSLDVLAFLNAFNALHPDADMDVNGLVNSLDVLAFLNAFNEGCP